MVHADQLLSSCELQAVSEPETGFLAEPWGVNVLLVEDNPEDAFAIERLLREAGDSFFVHRVCRLGEAREALRGQEFGVILLDFILPDGSGIDLVLALTAVSPLTPIVVLVEAEPSKVALQAVQAGAQDYLSKRELRAPELLRALLVAIERKRGESQLKYLVHYDGLTGLMNLARLKMYLSEGVQASESIALLFIDLNRFKQTCDAIGADVGEQILTHVADRLRGVTEPEDQLARVGADEFVVVLEGRGRVVTASALAREILAAIEAPFYLQEEVYRVTASVGVAERVGENENLLKLLERAQNAVGRAKRAGPDTLVVSPSLETSQRVAGDTVERALDNHELGLFYQPSVLLKDAQVAGTEALMRWHRPGQGEVRPAELLPLLNSTGLSVAIGDWILRQACHQAKRWSRDGEKFSLAVNIAPEQFAQEGLADTVADVLAETKLSAECLELEFSEPELHVHLEESLRLFEQLRRLGVRVVIDNFALRSSTLDVCSTPIDVLKLSRHLLVTSTQDLDEYQRVLALVESAHRLGIEVAAKGIETEEEYKGACQLGCDRAQGYYICSPMDAVGLTVWLASREAECE